MRLATSARLAADEKRLSLDAKQSAEALLDGYRSALDKGGEPDRPRGVERELRAMALRSLKDPVEFWSKLSE